LLSAWPSRSAESPKTTPSFLLKKPKMKIGLVTYNLAKDWDVETIIKNCQAARFDGVELRTTHAHKVDMERGKPEREAVRKRFQDSDIQLMGLGSAFDYHAPEPGKLKKDI